MAYLGNTPTTQSFISGTDYFNGTGSQTAFTLSRAVVSVNDIEAVVNNVVQQPNTAYTISGTTITFTSAPSSGTSNIYVRYLSTTTQSITPSQGTVNTNSIVDNAITAAKMAANGAWAPAGTVLQVVSFSTNTITSTTSTSFVATTLTASITPKFSTSKILVQFTGSIYAANPSLVAFASIFRNSSNMFGSAGIATLYNNSTNPLWAPSAGSYLDSPATTSTITYAVYIRTNGATIQFIDGTNGSGTITLTEIAG